MADAERQRAAQADDGAAAEPGAAPARAVVAGMRALAGAARAGPTGVVDFLAAGVEQRRAEVIRGLQATSGNRAVTRMLQRQATNETPLAGRSESAPGSTRFVADIVGHASPRWKSAPNPREADRRNRRLSERRAAAVRAALVRHARREFSEDPDISFEFDVSYRDPHESESTHVVGSDARGSTGARARGQPAGSDEEYDRRVDVTIRISNRRTVNAPYSTRRRIPSVTTDWAVAITGMVSGGFAVGAAKVDLLLRNRRTRQQAKGSANIFGGTTPELGGGGSADRRQLKWASFVTDEPVSWDEFDGTSMTVTYRGAGVFGFGIDKTTIGFPSFGRRAERLDVSGWATGGSAPGLAAWVKSGPFTLAAIPPPAMEDVEEPNPVELLETEDRYVPLHFPTAGDRLSASDDAALHEIVRDTAAEFRAARERRRTR